MIKQKSKLDMMKKESKFAQNVKEVPANPEIISLIAFARNLNEKLQFRKVRHSNIESIVKLFWSQKINTDILVENKQSQRYVNMFTSAEDLVKI
ncbi:hypothetical protein HYD49_00700 [Mycoplasmopsis bovis]|nr:hypothetical protein [Mycoplasmopsis bovis]QQH72704.1 hypothetical protein HYD49_00700 [Mycoplasmopsis bovis]